MQIEVPTYTDRFGAVRIYAGQMAVLRRRPEAPVIREMAEQEDEHLDRFNRLIADRQVRPTAFAPLWHVGGWLMGAGTALLGTRAAKASRPARRVSVFAWSSSS